MIRQLEAQYQLYDSVEDMLLPESLSDRLGCTVSGVTRGVFAGKGSSDSEFEQIKVDNQLFVLKRMKVLSDWLSLGTNDALCRSVRVWEYGVLDKLAPTIDHAIIAASLDGDGYAMLMRDVSDNLISDPLSFKIRDAKILIDALVTIHATFWNNDDLRQPELGLVDTKTTVESFWSHKYKDTTDSAPAPSWLKDIEKSWDLLFDYVEPDVRDTLQSLMSNPEPLYAKLAGLPSTLIHADFKPGNFAIMPETHQTIVFDWQVAGYTSPFIDLHMSLTSIVTETPFDGLEYYRQQLTKRLGEQLNQENWKAMLDLGYLAAVLRLGWLHAYWSHSENAAKSARVKYLPEFNEIVRNGVRWL